MIVNFQFKAFEYQAERYISNFGDNDEISILLKELITGLKEKGFENMAINNKEFNNVTNRN